MFLNDEHLLTLCNELNVNIVRPIEGYTYEFFEFF